MDSGDESLPWVEETAVQFQYKSLESDDSIRLLELEQSRSPEDPIRCKLIHVDRSESLQYEILSCDWHNKEADTVPISLNGQTFDAPSELWTALRKVRLDDQPRLLWTDAICINQHLEESDRSTDEQERNEQVLRLRNTYQRAEQLLIWLGSASDRSDLVFKHLETCSSHKHINWCHYKGETEQAFLQLCKRSWFYRVWSAQELALTKRAIVLCGDHRGDFLNLMKCSAFLSTNSYYHPFEGLDDRTHLQHLRDISRSPRVQLKNAFLCNRHCEAQNPKDKIFSIMGLDVSRQLRLDIGINYQADVSNVFRFFTRKIIEASQDLEILHWFGSQKHIAGLPSWVPDYSTSKPIGTLPRIFSGGAIYSVQYPFRLLSGFNFRPGGFLTVLGRRIERIAIVSDELEAKDTARPGSDEFQVVLHRWERLASKLTNKRFPQAIADAFSDTLVGNDEDDLLIENDQPPLIKKKRPTVSRKANEFYVWYKKYGSGILERTDPKYFEEVDYNRVSLFSKEAPSTEEGWRALAVQNYGRLKWYARQMEMTCCGRRFFITDKGSMGLAPPQGRKGDELVFLPGGRYPFVLRTRDDSTYELVGDCFLYDLDVFRLFQDPNIETREFVLV
ncbi:heterokaryon incompatibility protein-domain-containing protein [Whalleya microplaca]|nr:heterokaryon incompatibility protein-domain-containing protein [Whalleya microplaca]